MSLPTRSKLRGILVLVCLVALIVALHVAGRFGLGGPAELTIDGIREWAGRPVEMIATLARWLSLVFAYYLIVVLAAVVLLGERAETSGLARFAPSTVTSVIGLLLGASAVVIPVAIDSGTRAAPAVSPSTTSPSTTSPLNAVPLAAVSPSTSGMGSVGGAEPLVLRQMDGPLTLTETQPERDLQLVWSNTWSIVEQTDSADRPAGDSASAAQDSVWMVEPGDSFWSIAQETLEDEQPNSSFSEDEIAAYWRVVIAANEDSLVDPGNPDLLIPGQHLILPPANQH